MQDNRPTTLATPEAIRSRRELVIKLALAEVGKEENPPNSNRIEYNDWFYLTPKQIAEGKHADGPEKSWCCTFCMRILDKAGMPVGRADWMKGYASVPNIFNECKKPDSKLGRVITFEEALPGDLVIYDWDGNNLPDHIGFFHKRFSALQFGAIEGNTSFRNNSNGGEVMDRDDRKTSIGKMKVNFIRLYCYERA